jgi:hypothetical protein
VLISKTLPDGTCTEYPVSPTAIAEALAATLSLDSGLLGEEALCIRLKGNAQMVCEYRRPAKTALWLEGADEALYIPLPGLVLIRRTRAGSAPGYELYAVTERPAGYDAPLYQPPLPNSGPGGICWGTVGRVSDEALRGASLREDWAQLLGTRFGNHNSGGKSRKYYGDVRRMLVEVHERRARVWPRRDLVEARRTLGQALGVGA